MPTYNITNLDPAWFSAFPQVVSILSDPAVRFHADMQRYSDVLGSSLTLTVEQTAAVEALATQLAGRSIDDVATEFDGWNVPNGVYEVTGISETHRYNVHLVTSGDLTGQRVLKRYIDGRYKAFAYITRRGEMKLWRRFASDAEETYVTMAEELLMLVHDIGRDRLFSERSLHFPQRAVTIEFTPRCFHCNAQSEGSTEGACPSDFCQVEHPRYRIQAPVRYVNVVAVRAEEERIARERRERLEAQRRQMAEADARAAAERIERARARILRSEITPSEVR
jgi:hypothetical protein